MPSINSSTPQNRQSTLDPSKLENGCRAQNRGWFQNDVRFYGPCMTHKAMKNVVFYEAPKSSPKKTTQKGSSKAQEMSQRRILCSPIWPYHP